MRSKNREARRISHCGPYKPRNSASITSLAEQPGFNGREKCSLEFVSEVVAFCLFCFSSASSQLTTFSCLSLKRDFMSFEPKEVSVCFHPVTSQYLILKGKSKTGLFPCDLWKDVISCKRCMDNHPREGSS